jgi:hypothetical protein
MIQQSSALAVPADSVSRLQALEKSGVYREFTLTLVHEAYNNVAFHAGA